MVSNDPIKDYMQRHGCGFPEALEALAAQLGPPTAKDIRRALRTLGRAGAPGGSARGAGSLERRPDAAGSVTDRIGVTAANPTPFDLAVQSLAIIRPTRP